MEKLTEILEIVKDLVKPRKEEVYKFGLNAGQVVFEGTPATEEVKYKLNRFKERAERNKRNFGFY